MSTLGTRWSALQDRLQDSIADMSPRDRALLGGLVAFGVLGVIGLGLWGMNRTLSGLEGRVADREDQLELVRTLARDLAEASTTAEAVEGRIRASQGLDFSSEMEQAAQKVGITEQLKSVRKRSESADGTLQETIYEVKLSGVDQEQLARVLWEVEGTGKPARVRSLKVKTRARAEERSLDVDMDVATYQVLAAEAAPAAAGEEG
jgi:hypothetical protein